MNEDSETGVKFDKVSFAASFGHTWVGSYVGYTTEALSRCDGQVRFCVARQPHWDSPTRRSAQKSSWMIINIDTGVCTRLQGVTTYPTRNAAYDAAVKFLRGADEQGLLQRTQLRVASMLARALASEVVEAPD